MRHIHVEVAPKEAPLQLPAQEGDLPPPTALAQGPDPGVRPGAPRAFGQEELRLQKVYQLSIFSHRGGFSASAEPPSEDPQRPAPRLGLKRTLEETPLAPKRPHLQDTSPGEDLDGGAVLCGPSPGPGGPAYSCTLMEPRDSEGGLSPRSPPLSPSHTPSRRPAQHNHNRPIPDVFTPLSPKSPPPGCCEPPGLTSNQGPAQSPSPRAESLGGGRTASHSPGSPGGESCGNGCSSLGQPGPQPSDAACYETPGPASPTSPPGPFSPPHHTELLEPGEATEWEAGLESSPPERSATQAASSSSPACT
ncbi:unnamed protein product [Merluccius merluccius]